MGTGERAVVVLTTVPDAATAERIADALVGERLAACVTMLPPVRSTYRWQGKVERGEEIQLLIKTRADRYRVVEQRIVALHPYELPEILALPAVAGLAGYVDWVCAESGD